MDYAREAPEVAVGGDDGAALLESKRDEVGPCAPRGHARILDRRMKGLDDGRENGIAVVDSQGGI